MLSGSMLFCVVLSCRAYADSDVVVLSFSAMRQMTAWCLLQAVYTVCTGVDFRSPIHFLQLIMPICMFRQARLDRLPY